MAFTSSLTRCEPRLNNDEYLMALQIVSRIHKEDLNYQIYASELVEGNVFVLEQEVWGSNLGQTQLVQLRNSLDGRS